MRPVPIKVFATAFLASALLSAAHNLFVPGHLQARILDDAGVGAESFLPILAVRIAVACLLVWLVWARASPLARWIVVIFLVGRVWQLRTAWEGFLQGLTNGNWNSLMWSVESALCLIAVAALFSRGSRRWFADKGRTAASDVAVFE